MLQQCMSNRRKTALKTTLTGRVLHHLEAQWS